MSFNFLVIWSSTIGATIFLVTLVFASLLAMTGTNVNSMLELAAKLAGTYAGKLFQWHRREQAAF